MEICVSSYSLCLHTDTKAKQPESGDLCGNITEPTG